MAAMFEKTVSATEFKATCLELMNDIDSRKVDGIIVTKRGRPVARMVPIDDPKLDRFAQMHGCMKGSVTLPPDFDWDAPLVPDEDRAEQDARFAEKFRDWL